MAETFLDITATVPVPDPTFRAVVEPGSLVRLPEYLKKVGLGGRHVTIITDNNVAEHYGTTVTTALSRADIDNATIEMSAGEEHKNLESVERFWNGLATNKARRSEVIVALGGGVVGDMAGFVASTYKRGVEAVVQIPTSLTAMIDASIGGKTGFNLESKNGIGAFLQPRLILADPELLGTLGNRQYTEGWGEIIKTAILEPKLLPDVEAHAETLRSFSPQIVQRLSGIIARCVQYKIDVIAQDPLEKNKSGGRVLLNYGHTLAHALESAGNYTELLHGEAVAIGIGFAALLASQLGVLQEPSLIDRQKALLEDFHLPARYQGRATPDAIMRHMGADKKNTSGDTTRMILPVRVGEFVVQEISNTEMRKSVEAFLAETN